MKVRVKGELGIQRGWVVLSLKNMWLETGGHSVSKLRDVWKMSEIFRPDRDIIVDGFWITSDFSVSIIQGVIVVFFLPKVMKCITCSIVFFTSIVGAGFMVQFVVFICLVLWIAIDFGHIFSKILIFCTFITTFVVINF